MNKKLAIIIFLAVFITACTQGDTERGFGSGNDDMIGDAFSGTKGITMVLEQESKIVTFPDETITFPVRVTNDGRYDTTVTLYVSGYDESLVQYTQKQQTMTLQGKKSAGAGESIPGETKIVYFTTSPVKLVGNSLRQDTAVTACFEYETALTYGVCVDRNANGQCDLSSQPQNNGLSSGQAAPVAISSISAAARGPSSGKTIVTYIIRFAQVDNTAQENPRVVKKEKITDACAGSKLNDYLDFNFINIDEVRLGADVELNCPAITDNRPLNLNTPLTCYAELPYENTDYISGLNIKATYGFLKTITQPIEIQSLT